MRKKKLDIKLIKSLKKYTSLIVTLLIIAIFFYPFIKEWARRSSIKNSPKRFTKAIVTAKKAYDGNSPVSHSFSYKYKFEVDTKKYYGTSHNEQLIPGDTIEIEFVITNPDQNAPKGYYDQ